MIVLGCDALNSSIELLKKSHDIEKVIILSNKVLILCWKKDRVSSTRPKLLSVTCSNVEEWNNTFEEIEFFRNKNIAGLFGGGGHAVVLTENGEIFGWGDNSHGQIGYLEDGDEEMCSFRPISFPIFIPLNSVVQVACGNSHTLFLLKTGYLYSMGNNEYGQLGIGKKKEVSYPTLVSCLHGLPILQIVAGGWHSFCITVSGRVFSWGRNDFGQLGLETTKKKLFPNLMKGFAENSVAFIAAGEYHNALLTKGGEFFTFGKGLHGQLGHGGRENEHAPRRVEELKGSVVTQVACGTNHTVAYVPDCDKIFVFGSNENGQLGATKTEHITEPIMLGDETCVDKFHKIYAQSNITCLFDWPQDSIRPNDYRVINEQRRIATLEGTCGKAGAEKFISKLMVPASSFQCLNASFFLAGQICTTDFPSIDFDAVHQAAKILLTNFVDKDFGTFATYLVDMLKTLNDELCDIEALRFYIIFPALMENITKMMNYLIPSQAQNDLTGRTRLTAIVFIEKLCSINRSAKKFLKKWYASLTPDSFSLILNFYIRLLEFSLRCLNVQLNALLLDQVNTLHDINNDKKLVSFEEYYLGDVPNDVLYQEYVFWSEKMKGNPQLRNTAVLLEYPFLLNPKAKCLLLEFRTKARLGLSRMLPLQRNIIQINREVDDIAAEVKEKFVAIKDPQKPLEVKFLGEEGIDDGALSNELFRLVIESILKPECGLFVEDEDSKFLWFNRKASEDSLEFYHFVGKFCALGVCNAIVMGLNFPVVLYKKVLGKDTCLLDLKELHPTYGNVFERVLSFVRDDDITKLDLYFTTIDDGVLLKEEGDNIPVTLSNREEYVELYKNFLLEVSVEKQLKAFSDGFLTVFAMDNIILKLFKPEELMKMIRGTQDYNWNELKKNTVYDNFSPEEETIVWFWEVLLSLSREEKQMFLVYLTGSNTVPISGLKMVIAKREECDDYLPCAACCYNILFLHPYSSKDILKERLKTAMKCKGFHSK